MSARGISLAVVAAAAVAFPASAFGVPGDLTYQGCITGEDATGPTGTGACAAIPGASLNGVESGLDKLESVAVSPDGRSVYVVAGLEDDAVAHFSRDPVTGAISFVACHSGDTSLVDCTPITGADNDGLNTGLSSPESVAVSPDGTSVYATSRFDDAVAQFRRDPVTGALTYIGCDSSETASVGPCDAIATPTANGANSGFDDPKIKSVVFSADGRFVYAASAEDDSVVVFDRNTSSGELSFDSCVSGELESSPPCDAIDTAISGGDNSGLDDPRWLVAGPDDISLYVVISRDHGIARFSRNPTTGALAFEDCVTGDTAVGPGGSGACDEIPSATSGGNDSGFANPRAMAISSDGEFAYAVGANDAAILSFDRNVTTGTLAYLGCLSGEATSGPSPGSGACTLLPTVTEFSDASGFNGMRSMALSRDGVSLYTSAQFDDALATFDRDPATGLLTFDRCVTGDSDVDCTELPDANPGGEDSGFDELETIALSADDRSLYGASEFDDAVSRFDREPVPQPAEVVRCRQKIVTKMSGTTGDDTLTGTELTDAIFGLGGADSIDGAGGNDCLEGDGGRDRVRGGAGKDKVKGDGGRDRVGGGGGRDKVLGGGGKDRLSGGPGKDKIKAGGGRDRINCGGGRDKVVASGSDRVAGNCERVKLS